MVQITELKRQLSQRVPYEELMTKAEISRLSSDLHTLRARSRSKGRRSRRTEYADEVGGPWLVARRECEVHWCSASRAGNCCACLHRMGGCFGVRPCCNAAVSWAWW
jgi:hypothetical protein